MLYTVDNSIYTSFTDSLYISFINLFYDFYVFGIHTLYCHISRCTSMYYDVQTCKYMFYVFYLINNFASISTHMFYCFFLCVVFYYGSYVFG